MTIVPRCETDRKASTSTFVLPALIAASSSSSSSGSSASGSGSSSSDSSSSPDRKNYNAGNTWRAYQPANVSANPWNSPATQKHVLQSTVGAALGMQAQEGKNRSELVNKLLDHEYNKSLTTRTVTAAMRHSAPVHTQTQSPVVLTYHQPIHMGSQQLAVPQQQAAPMLNPALPADARIVTVPAPAETLPSNNALVGQMVMQQQPVQTMAQPAPAAASQVVFLQQPAASQQYGASGHAEMALHKAMLMVEKLSQDDLRRFYAEKAQSAKRIFQAWNAGVMSADPHNTFLPKLKEQIENVTTFSSTTPETPEKSFTTKLIEQLGGLNSLPAFAA